MIILDGNHLNLEQAKKIIFDHEKVSASEMSLEKVIESRNAVEKILQEGRTIYGINTGFGKLSEVRIGEKDTEQLQVNLIRSHACGVGNPFPETVVRGMLLFRANALLKGYSGVRPEIIHYLLEFLNRGIHPVIPEQGSLGASGDLAPLSHLALALIGEGEVFYRGERLPAVVVLEREGINPLTLKAKEGLALINGTQAMTAVGVVSLLEAQKLANMSDWIASLTLEALQGIIDAFDERIHLARGFQEQTETASSIRKILEGSRLITRQGQLRVQDAYSLRCIPQVHGASKKAIHYVAGVLETEMNAATDNPLIFYEDDEYLSGGNFHGQPVALAMDFLKIAVSELANISERRVERLVNPQLNDLPPFLSSEPGLQSGAMIMQYTAASLVSENKVLAHPASVDSIPSSGNQEDHVSMGTIAARNALQIVQNTWRVLAIEMICAMQALEYRGIENMATRTKKLYEEGRKVIPTIHQDRVFSYDIEKMTRWLKEVPVEKLV